MNQETVQQLQQAPIEERLRVIELLLQSLKQDILAREEPRDTPPFDAFTARQFNLGQDIQVDRDTIYGDMRI